MSERVEEEPHEFDTMVLRPLKPLEALRPNEALRPLSPLRPLLPIKAERTNILGKLWATKGNPKAF